MAAGFDMVRAQGALKTVFDGKMNEILYGYDNAKLNPGFVDLRRSSGGTVQTPFGNGWALPIKTQRGGGVSADYATANTIANLDIAGVGPSYSQFIITPRKLITLHVVQGDVLDRAASEGTASFIKAASETMKDAVEKHMRRLCIYSDGTGDGVLGTITAFGASYVRLAVGNFRKIVKGDHLVAAATATGALRSATARYVTARSRTSVTAGSCEFTLDTDPTALGWQVGDVVKFLGDTNVATIGYKAWAPIVAPSGSESFYGIDRSTDAFLYGMYFDATGLDVTEALIQATAQLMGEGGMPTRIRLSINDMATLIRENQDLKSIVLASENLSIGFKAVEIVLPGFGPMPIMQDESLPDGEFMVENEKDWGILSTDRNLAHIVSHDGLQIRKQESADAWVVFVKSLTAPFCRRPGLQLRGSNLGS